MPESPLFRKTLSAIKPVPETALMPFCAQFEMELLVIIMFFVFAVIMNMNDQLVTYGVSEELPIRLTRADTVLSGSVDRVVIDSVQTAFECMYPDVQPVDRIILNEIRNGVCGDVIHVDGVSGTEWVLSQGCGPNSNRVVGNFSLLAIIQVDSNHSSAYYDIRVDDDIVELSSNSPLNEYRELVTTIEVNISNPVILYH